MDSNKSLALLSIILLLSVSNHLHAQTKSWDAGGGTNNWHDADNWDPNGVPTSFSDINLTRSSDSVYINGNAFANSIHLASDLVIPENVTLRIIGLGIDKPLELSRRCYLENQGHIIIEGGQEDAIFVDGEECQLINKSNGTISILSSGDDGINLVSGQLTNQKGATIIISKIVGDGIINNDTITNRGNIMIADCSTAISNSGSFKNTTSGQISCYKSFDGIENYSQFSNNGTITITKFRENGILNDDDDNSSTIIFNNQGDLIIDSIGDDGIYNRGYFLNDTSGSIIIQNSENIIKSNGITNQDSFDNHGSLIIRGITTTGVDAVLGQYYNTGSTKLKQCGITGLLVQDGAFFRNENQSSLIVDDCEVPINVMPGSTFNCKGVLIAE